ncbi:hypothetical protein TNIN_61181 [Trichonephila inaurata madagascariensis]|uniref:Uncharacterized protein n=1 Tax=Trichonephila inaurata madagascariensis TaxID=2747483 RepID=A0A8X6IRQ5_9ARAC|nr:hypothetical protein TNIN_61181 [Trichonephila inaurata madagascariensis]
MHYNLPNESGIIGVKNSCHNIRACCRLLSEPVWEIYVNVYIFAQCLDSTKGTEHNLPPFSIQQLEDCDTSILRPTINALASTVSKVVSSKRLFW